MLLGGRVCCVACAPTATCSTRVSPFGGDPHHGLTLGVEHVDLGDARRSRRRRQLPETLRFDAGRIQRVRAHPLRPDVNRTEVPSVITGAGTDARRRPGDPNRRACPTSTTRPSRTPPSCDRFGIEPHNAARASRLINEAAEAGMIRARDPRRPRSCQQHLPAGGPKLGPSVVRRSRGKRSDIGLPPAIPGALYGPECSAVPTARGGVASGDTGCLGRRFTKVVDDWPRCQLDQTGGVGPLNRDPDQDRDHRYRPRMTSCCSRRSKPWTGGCSSTRATAWIPVGLHRGFGNGEQSATAVSACWCWA